MPTLREQGWAYYDAIVEAADLKEKNPWHRRDGVVTYVPDYDTLELLLGVPVLLGATSQSGVPALALDVWVSYEFRRAGFESDRVWPRPTAPRVLPSEIQEFIGKLPKGERDVLKARIVGGSGGMSAANLLGKNYVKQVDVVMSSWATGPELMVSTKRMDSSFGKNAANRVEESYGDAKNLRLRHPQAALGFFYALSAVALVSETAKAEWLIDLLTKLGREDDAYDAVALVLPDLRKREEPTDPEPADETGPLEAGAETEPADGAIGSGPPEVTSGIDLTQLRRVEVMRDEVPADLDPGRFFHILIGRLLDNSPINFHKGARGFRSAPIDII